MLYLPFERIHSWDVANYEFSGRIMANRHFHYNLLSSVIYNIFRGSGQFSGGFYHISHLNLVLGLGECAPPPHICISRTLLPITLKFSDFSSLFFRTPFMPNSMMWVGGHGCHGNRLFTATCLLEVDSLLNFFYALSVSLCQICLFVNVPQG